VSIRGVVHGGQQGVAGAHIFLFAANTTGNAGPGLAAVNCGLPAANCNASISLLKNVAGVTAADGNSSNATYGDYYVTSASDGSFSITGDYTSCTSGQQVYLYAVGGNPGLPPPTNNTAAGFLAVLGACPAGGNFAAMVPSLYVDEVTTVAAAYAFAGYASDAVHVSNSGSTLAQTGIANAFANAANLANCHRNRADDDTCGERDGAAEHDQHDRRHTGLVRELERCRDRPDEPDRLLHAVQQHHVRWRYRTAGDRHSYGGDLSGAEPLPWQHADGESVRQSRACKSIHALPVFPAKRLHGGVDFLRWRHCTATVHRDRWVRKRVDW
jgi:hypothetical protein